MLLSLCIIMRDPGEEIISCLSSAAGVQEIVVCDTGSRDGAPERVQKWLRKWQAGKMGRRGVLCHCKWRDDFAAARNFALSKATGDWVLWLDSDEQLTGAGSLAALLQGLAQGLLPAGTLVRSQSLPHVLEFWRVNVDEAGQKLADHEDDIAVRMMRRLPGLAYRGEVHEQLLFEDGRELISAVLPKDYLHILHSGYAPERMAAKGSRNAAILLKEKAQGGETFLLDYYLAAHYLEEGNWQEAARHAKASMQGHRPVHDDFAPWRQLYQARSGQARSLREKYGLPGAEGSLPKGASHGAVIVRAAEKKVEEALAEGIKAFPLYPDFYYLRGGRRWNRDEKIQGLEDIKLALSYHAAFAARFPGQENHFTELLSGCLAAKAQMEEELREEGERPFLSACVIMRDSEEDIALCLESLQEADEIIVVDTGSVDKSVEIAKKYTDKIYHFQWIDDFAAAKNYALEKARGDWIVFLDSDEYFSEQGRELRAMCQAAEARKDIESLILKMQNVDLQGRPFGAMGSVERVFRRGLKYKGRIHEYLAGSEGRSPVPAYVPREKIFLYHRGYAPERLAQKAARNRKLIEEARPGEIMNPYGYLAQAAMMGGDFAAARDNARLSLQAGETSGTMRFEICRIFYRACLSLGDKAGCEEALQAMEERFPLMPDSWAIRGAALWNEGKEDEGAPLLLRALELIADFQQNNPGEINELANDAQGIYENLREYYEKRGDGRKLDKIKLKLK
ncbi:MAG: glycosyltransferase [Selenomonas ruminantium]|nr:glycosyltransferase [Selenomonas ruminantium]